MRSRDRESFSHRVRNIAANGLIVACYVRGKSYCLLIDPAVKGRTAASSGIFLTRRAALEGTDMPRYELELRLDAPGAADFGGALSDESERVRADVYRKLGLKVRSNAWVRINLSSAKGMVKVQQVIDECDAGRVRAGTANLYEHLDKGESNSADWFYLSTRTANGSFSLWDGYPSYILSELTADHAYNHTFVSQEFVDVCKQSGLRGVSFLRCRNKGRTTGPAWYAALPEHSLGRGLDHCWLK